ncbi:MAG: ADP-ribosylglycohydrolase family protein [Oscillospiraceae bacterium]|nr:ADP-ribosylglycohydrolase family protein [Oscillospiraceae bacterium]
MHIELNRKMILDKIHGCWLGKNIGGTIGGPFEGNRRLLDIQGFTTEKGEPLPNDDLDLQLVWLLALEAVGAKKLTANELSDYWLSYIAPHWNEYGVAKSNLAMGFLPPLSGELHNEKWKTSNGAWIRSELWACLTPGFPNIAVKYAIMDASIDHGLSEGTHAEVFTAVLESLAFFESNIRTLIETALTYIPDTSMITSTVRLVLDCYDKQIPWQETRDRIVENVKSVGWFQAAGNIGFTVLGLMYGEGDMLKSLCYAVNCGDDTDCTAGTVGAVMGIIMGAEGIPQELKEYVGDRIVTISINGSYHLFTPKTCTELTSRVMKLIPEVFVAHGVTMDWTGENIIDTEQRDKILAGYAHTVFARSPLSFEVPGSLHTQAIVEYKRDPIVKPGEDFSLTITLQNLRRDSRYYSVLPYLPAGWTADYDRTAHSTYMQRPHGETGITKIEMTIRVGEKIEPINQFPVIIQVSQHGIPITVPIVLLG